MSIGQGTEEYTVQSIMDRLYLQILNPPDKQPIHVRLGQDVVSVDQDTILLGGFTVPEDALLLRQGALLEMDQELVRVVAYDDISGSVTVTRGEYGTTPALHFTPLLMVMNPPYARAVVFEAVADNIIQLYPKLFTAFEELVSPVTDRVYSISDELAVSVLSIQPGDFTSTIDIHGEIIDFHPMVGGRALIANVGSGSLWLRYRRRMGKATQESDVLADLGVDERWIMIVTTGAAADLLSGRDLTAAQTEWIKSVLEAENIRVGTRISLAGGLRQYRNQLLKDAMQEMKGEYKPKIRMRQATAQYT